MTQFLRNLSTFNKEEIDNFLESFDTVLTDADGVLWLMEDPLEGSAEVINRLKDLGKKIFVVSNNCTLSLDEYKGKIKKSNLKIEEDEIVFPSVVIADYFKDKNFNKKAFILGSPCLIEILEANGIKLSSDVGPNHELDSPRAFREEMTNNMDSDVGAVIIDFDLNINYAKMMKALFHLQKPDCLFVAGACDFIVPVHRGVNILGVGSFISTIETVSGRKAVVTGKPSPLVKEFISRKHHLVPERTLMIGDSISVDMQLGTNCGFQKLLVLSGVNKLEDTKEDSQNLPHYYLNTLGDLLPLLPSS